MRDILKQSCENQDLRFLGIVDLNCNEDYDRYRRWLQESRHGEMHYLEKHSELRRRPELLLPGAQSAIVMALPYHLGDSLKDFPTPRVAQYARFGDYHKILKRRGEAMVASLTGQFPAAQFRVAVDTAPLLERALAAKSLHGFIGKNTCYIHPTDGSFFLLAEMLTTLSLPIDNKKPLPLDRKTKEGGCGKCQLCQVACPTGALATDYQIDAKLCLSYWTIEHRGVVPEQFWPHFEKYWYGCDLCQLACPYNLHGHERAGLPMSIGVRIIPPLFEVATMDQAGYERFFGGTAMTRAKRSGLKRNALIAMTVTRDPKLGEATQLAQSDAEFPIPETLRQIASYRGLD